MRKSRIKLMEINEELFNSIASDMSGLGGHLKSLNIKSPEWSKILLFSLKGEDLSVEVVFYEDAKDFFLFYTKKIIKQSDDNVIGCFDRVKDGDWKEFAPPTLIGINLKTKLRKGMDVD